MNRYVAGLCGVAATGLVATAGPAADAERTARAFLAGQFNLSANDFRDLDRGQVVARSLDVSDPREVATLGVMRVAVPAAYYIDQLRDIETFKGQSDAVLAIGRFSRPAAIDDVVRLPLTSSEIDSLRDCERRDCDVQLSATAIADIRSQVPWRTANEQAAATQAFQRVLVQLVNDYRAKGDDAVMTYEDSDDPVATALEFRAMVDAHPAILKRFPALYQHVVDFPRRAQPGVEDLIYWSKERLGPAAIVTVTHMAIARLPDAPPQTFAAASRQLYGSRYFDASLGLTIALNAATDSASAFVVYVNRSRIDTFRGLLGGLKRRIVRSQTRSAMDDTMAAARDASERRYRAAPR